jgi:HAD superfamily hydrolase (TIGR01459 family)
MYEANIEWALNAYRQSRARLPDAEFPEHSEHVSDLSQLADRFDVFLLDAFGVLNIGETAIEGVAERIAQLRALGKKVAVVTNAAGYPASHLHGRYRRLGFAFSEDEVFSSRATLLRELANMAPRCWGIIAHPKFGFDELPQSFELLTDNPETYERVEGILMLGASAWNDARQELLVRSIAANPRPVLVGNPDIVAPYEGGLSREPGYYAHLLADATGHSPVFFGKPFANVFAYAMSVLGYDAPAHRILMVGDTLHTDILGGRAAGFKTALVTGYGFFCGADPEPAIRQSGLVPDFIMPRP